MAGAYDGILVSRKKEGQTDTCCVEGPPDAVPAESSPERRIPFTECSEQAHPQRQPVRGCRGPWEGKVGGAYCKVHGFLLGTWTCPPVGRGNGCMTL